MGQFLARKGNPVLGGEASGIAKLPMGGICYCSHAWEDREVVFAWTLLSCTDHLSLNCPPSQYRYSQPFRIFTLQGVAAASSHMARL